MRAFLLTMLLLGACSSHELRCDAHLSAINAPASPIAPSVDVDRRSRARWPQTPEQGP
jgi:hypothetical protein